MTAGRIRNMINFHIQWFCFNFNISPKNTWNIKLWFLNGPHTELTCTLKAIITIRYNICVLVDRCMMIIVLTVSSRIPAPPLHQPMIQKWALGKAWMFERTAKVLMVADNNWWVHISVDQQFVLAIWSFECGNSVRLVFLPLCKKWIASWQRQWQLMMAKKRGRSTAMLDWISIPNYRVIC